MIMKHHYVHYMLLTLLISMFGFGKASAQRAYALYNESTHTLTFKYDAYWQQENIWELNTGSNDPGWYTDGTYAKVETVVFDTSFAQVRPTSTYRWFYYMENLSEIEGLERLNTSEVTNMEWMFAHCSSDVLYNLPFDTKNVTTMRGMFAYCDMTNFSLYFNTSNVTDMSRMFFDCTKLEVLDLSSLNTSKVTDMKSMFRNCGALKTIYVGAGWDRSRVSLDDSEDMFLGCSSIVGGAGTTYNPLGPDKAYAQVDQGGANPGYLTLNDQYAVYSSGDSMLMFYCDSNMGNRTGTVYYLNRIGGREAWRLNGTNKLVKRVAFDESFANVRPTKIGSWFWQMENLEYIVGMEESLNTSEVTDLSNMFSGCSSLKNVDLSGFDTRNVTNMNYMFAGCRALTTIYVGDGWNTSKVSYNDNMFAGCKSLVGSQGTAFDESHVDLAYACPDGSTDAPGYLTLGAPYVVYDSERCLTFYCDTQRSTRTGTTYSLNVAEDYPGWHGKYPKKVVFDPSFAVARPTTTAFWFSNQPELDTIQGMDEYLNTCEVTDMNAMFSYATSLTTLDLKSFNTEKVTCMDYMFQHCSALQALNLSSFNTHRVESIERMFAECRSLKVIYVGDGWNVDNAKESSSLFWNCTELVGGKGTTYDEAQRGKAYAHVDGGPDNPGYLTTMVPYVVYNDGTLSFYQDMYITVRPGTAYLLPSGFTPEWYDDGNYKNVSSVVFDPSFADARPTSTRFWFVEMAKLESITGMKEYLNTSEVDNMHGMFFGCSALKSVQVNKFDTQKVTMMNSMFNGCSSLTTLDLSSFNTENVTDMAYMFQNCSNLKTIYVGLDWNAQDVRTTVKMFDGCTSLVGGQGTTYDPEYTDGARAVVDGGIYRGYLTLKEVLPGDVNDDGQVGIGDIVAITNVMAGTETDTDIIARADVNGDDEVGIGDIVAVTNIMAGTE